MEIAKLLSKLTDRQDLTAAEMTALMREIMTGKATPAQIGSALTALMMKGETVTEVVAAATVMRELALQVPAEQACLVDTCGTGGSGSRKFNVSTASAFVAAAAGAKVAKHGNRAATGNSGSADLLEAAGARLDLNPQQVGRCIDTVGLGFLFAANHHQAMKHAKKPREELKIRTLFNVLGPLTNPAGAKRQVMGVFSPHWLRPLAEVLYELGSEHVLLVHSNDGLDEISIAAPTQIVEMRDGQYQTYQLKPEDFGMRSSSLEPLRVANSAESLALVSAALNQQHEAATNIVCLNAGAAIFVAGLTADLHSGVMMAQDVIASGQAAERMQVFVDFTVEIAGS
ncbi:MAG: anthranilate phosphoribosyltransferase [Gammaproteobacteria bacterium]|nr:anthranilate phosphoribosyltransferase [Gammaproteobacteria bacterium]